MENGVDSLKELISGDSDRFLHRHIERNVVLMDAQRRSMATELLRIGHRHSTLFVLDNSIKAESD